MPKSKKRSRANPPAARQKATGLSRRTLLVGGLVGIAGTAGATGWAVRSFRSFQAEHDLTRVGQGNPTIVQIHDPQCTTCTALQRQTRRALGAMDDCGLTYLVADIKTPKGAAFAGRYGVSNVTLLLFDGQGELQRTVRGMQDATHLVEVFSAHKAATA